MSASQRQSLSLALLLFAVVMLAMNLRAPLVAVGPVVGMIRDELQISGSLMGFVTALPLLAFASLALGAAPLARRLGIENVLTVSALVMLIGLGIRSGAGGVGGLILGTALLSAGIAMGNVLLPALAKKKMPQHIGLVVGLISATMSAASTLSAAIAVPLAQWQNWRWPLGIWMLTALIAGLAWLRIRAVDTDAGTPPDGSAPPRRLPVWRMPAAWAVSLCMGFQSVIFYGVVSFLPSVLVEKGMSALAAGAYGSVFQGTSLIGVIAISALFGRHQRLLQPIGLLIALVLLAGVAGVWLDVATRMWLWVSLLGIGAAGLFSLSLMLFAARTTCAADAATLSGMAQAVGYAIAILGPQGMGFLYDRFGSWIDTMPLLVALAATECFIVWFASSPQPLVAPAQAETSSSAQ